MEIIRTNKYRLYPTAKQKSLLHNMFGQTRFVFNSVLNMIQECKFGSYVNKKIQLVDLFHLKLFLLIK